MLSNVFFLILVFKLVFTSKLHPFHNIPENFIVREIPEYFEFKDLVSLSQASRLFRTSVFDHMISLIIRIYPDFPELNTKDKWEFCSCLLKPCKYYENFQYQFNIVPFKNYSNSEHFILALISSPRSILKNTEIALFILRTFIGINNSNRSAVNHSFIEDALVDNILPVHFFNKPVIKEFLRFYKCPRSFLLTHLYNRGQFKLDNSYFFYNKVVFRHYSVIWSFAALFTAALHQLIFKSNWSLFSFICLFFFSLFLAEKLFDSFLII
jgi:hypothetical protein